MKKIFSLFLSAVILFSMSFQVNLSAYAGGWVDKAQHADYDTLYTAYPSKSDAGEHINDMGVTIDRYFDAFRFSVPVEGKVILNMEALSEYYFPLSYGSRIDYIIYNATNVDKETEFDYSIVNSGFSSARNIYHGEYEWTLPAGDYYLVFEYDYNSFWGFYQEGTCEFSLSYTPLLSKPSKFKVSSRKNTSLKLSWSKVGNVAGYEIQRASGKTYKTVANAVKNSYTVKKLKAGTNYRFRIRSYVAVNGKKYYSGWTTLSTATKPNKVSIKKPTTNSKHQIKVKWNSVSACSGYQVQFSRKKNFSSVIATKTVSGRTKTSYTGKNFTKGRTYYVRVRAYKIVNGTKYYGAWSRVKSIKSK